MFPSEHFRGGGGYYSEAPRFGDPTGKVDVKSAYRLVPVSPRDRHLMGVEWQGALYVDGCLPFGLHSAPKVFTAVADALQWVMLTRGVTRVQHHLDDFITMGRPDSPECSHNLDTILAVCVELGVPLARDKLKGPATRLTFLGIELDTGTGIMRLPVDKLSHLRVLLAEWSAKKVCRRPRLESLTNTTACVRS